MGCAAQAMIEPVVRPYCVSSRHVKYEHNFYVGYKSCVQNCRLTLSKEQHIYQMMGTSGTLEELVVICRTLGIGKIGRMFCLEI